MWRGRPGVQGGRRAAGITSKQRHGTWQPLQRRPLGTAISARTLAQPTPILLAPGKRCPSRSPTSRSRCSVSCWGSTDSSSGRAGVKARPAAKYLQHKQV